MGRALRFAGTMELAGLDLSIQRRRLNAVVESVKHYMRLPELRIIEVWCGLRPLTPDGLPILGRPRSFKNLILATAILLATLWFALDAGIEALTLLS